MPAATDPKEPNIRKIYLPGEEEKNILRHVYRRKQEMGDARAKMEPDWDKWQKQWDSYRIPKGSDDWKSNIFIPITASIIESELAEIVNQDMMPWALARGMEDEPKAQVMNALIQYTWDVSKSNVALFQILKDALIFGTGIGMEFYWKEPRTIKHADGKTEDILEYDDCYLKPIRLQDFYVDERAQGFSGPDGARDCVWRQIMDYDDFRNFFKGKVWDPLGQASLVKPGGDTNYYEFYKPPERIDQSREVEVLWYYNKPDDVFCVVANDVVIRNEPNPYKHKQLPFIRIVDVVRPYQFYGKGECELLESLQEEINTLRRMIIDRNHLDIDKPILTSDSLTLEDEDAAASPHRVIPVGDVTQIKFPEYSDIALSVFKTLEMLGDDKVRITGMDERQQSVAGAGTATEASILKEATLKRLNMKMWNVKNDTLVDIGKLRVSNILQFYSQPKLNKILGDDMVQKAQSEGTLTEIDGEKYKKSFRGIRLQDQRFNINDKTRQPEILPTKGFTFFEARPEYFTPTYGSFDIRYKASSSLAISKPLQQQKADEMYDRLVQNPTVDQWALAEYLIKTREEDPDKFKLKQQSAGAQGQDQNAVDPQKMIDLASVENQEMLQGNKIGPTPYASVVHTQVHIDFMNSEKFKKEVPPEDTKVLQIFSDHVTGEIAAITSRGGDMGAMGQGTEGQPPMMSSGAQIPPAQAPQMGNVMPGMVQGGGQVASGMAGAKAGIAGGRKI